MNARQGDQPIEVVFRVDDPTYPFVAVSREGEVVASLERMLPRGDGKYAEFFSITGADPDRVVELAESSERVRETRIVTREDDSGLFEFTIASGQRSCPARDLAELGAIPREVTGAHGEGTIVVEVVGRTAASELVSGFLETHPNADLVAKHEIDDETPLLTTDELENAVDESLTDRQQEVILTAFESGYYDWPRTCTGEEVADSLGIASSTFSEHIHAAERKLLELTMEGPQ